MILPIYTEGQPVLRQVTEPILEVTPELRQLVTDMRQTMHNAKGVGLAAPQVGKGIALCIIELKDNDEDIAIPFMALLNPRITWKSTGQNNQGEACLSIPGIEGPVKRSKKIRAKARSLEGETIELEAEGFLARVLQHEIDHLNGILFTDYVPKSKLERRSVSPYPII